MPIHETERNRKAEREIGEIFAASQGLHFIQFPILYPIDGCLINQAGEVLWWLEIKDRDNPMSQYPSLMIDYSKLLNLRRRMATMANEDVRAGALIRWTCGTIAIAHVWEWSRWRVQIGRRKKPRGNGEMVDEVDAVVYLENDLFTSICELTRNRR